MVELNTNSKTIEQSIAVTDCITKNRKTKNLDKENVNLPQKRHNKRYYNANPAKKTSSYIKQNKVKQKHPKSVKSRNIRASRAPGRSTQLPRPSPAPSAAVRTPPTTSPCPGVGPGLLRTSETATNAGRWSCSRKAVAFLPVFAAREEEEKKSLGRERGGTNLWGRQNASVLYPFFKIFNIYCLKKYCFFLLKKILLR